jgi:alkylation response protein AidB-like acyl-CoA dehydrogenase
MLVAARTDPELTPDAISLFIVELPNPGFVITKLKKESVRSSETGLIHIDDAFVPDDCLLGARTGTYPVILDSLSENRVGVAANALGMARAAFEAARRYANDRIVAGKRIGDYQAIGHKLADMAADIEAAKLAGLPRRLAGRPGHARLGDGRRRSSWWPAKPRFASARTRSASWAAPASCASTRSAASIATRCCT